MVRVCAGEEIVPPAFREAPVFRSLDRHALPFNSVDDLVTVPSWILLWIHLQGSYTVNRGLPFTILTISPCMCRRGKIEGVRLSWNACVSDCRLAAAHGADGGRRWNDVHTIRTEWPDPGTCVNALYAARRSTHLCLCRVRELTDTKTANRGTQLTQPAGLLPVGCRDVCKRPSLPLPHATGSG